MQKSFKKRFKFIHLVWLSSFALALFIYFITITPQIKIKKQIALQLVDKEKKFSSIFKINNAQAVNELNRQMQQWRDDIKEYVISDEDLAGLTFDISQIAKDTQVDAFSITSQDVYTNKKNDNKNYVFEKMMKVSFKTDFNKFAAFLNTVERHRPVIIINEFSIENTEHDAMANQVNMIISVYIKKKQDS